MRVIGGRFGPAAAAGADRATLLAMASRVGAAHRVVTGGGIGVFATEGLALRGTDAGFFVVADVDLTNLAELRKQTGLESVEDVLIALYERKGLRFVRELQGGFALAIWDAQARTLMLGVDRFGICRLYYATGPQQASFASRSDVLRAATGIDVSLGPSEVLQYLNFGYVPAPRSIFRGIRRIPPGHVVLLGDGEAVIQRYWDLEYTERPIDREAAAVEMYRRTEGAVIRVLSDVPMKETGAYLSGGTDSSTMVGLMSRLTRERVNAFSIGFKEERYNELTYAEISANHFGAAHYTHVIDAAEALAIIPRLVEAYDEPFGNDSAIGTAVCAQLAAECGVTRLIAGDGGDEIFGGNERYRTDAIFGLYHRLPRAIRNVILEPALHALPDGGTSVIGRAQRYIRRANIPNPQRFYSYEFHFLQEADRFLAPEFVAAAGSTAPLDVLEAHWGQCPATAELNRLLYLDMKLTIGDNDLYKVTRTAEMSGVRVAFPLLDPTLVEFMAALPARYKVRALEKRYLFKQAFRDLLPPATLAKRKHGFGVPVARWIRDDKGFAELARDALLGSSARTSAWFRPGAVEQLFALHASDTTPFYGSLVWTVLMLELWHRQHAGAGSHP